MPDKYGQSAKGVFFTGIAANNYLQLLPLHAETQYHEKMTYMQRRQKLSLFPVPIVETKRPCSIAINDLLDSQRFPPIIQAVQQVNQRSEQRHR